MTPPSPSCISRSRGYKTGAVQETLHAQGHFLCIDGLTGPDLAAIDYGRLTADYYKVGWHPDFLAEDAAKVRLRKLLQGCAVGRRRLV